MSDIQKNQLILTPELDIFKQNESKMLYFVNDDFGSGLHKSCGIHKLCGFYINHNL